jgi:bile acid:Na+ symporter, BASS family
MTWLILLKISLVIFIAGNLLEMGLKLNPADALRGLRNARFVAYTLLWGFVLGPAVAYGITLILPLDPSYALGLILLGMAPSAPFLPMLVNKAKGDLGFTAAFMILISIGTVVCMPLTVPLLAKGLSVSPWTIAKPLVMMILLPLAVGMYILHWNKNRAKKLNPVVKKTTGVFALATVFLSVLVYGKGLTGVGGSYAIVALMIFFTAITVISYWFSFGLKHSQKIIISIGMSTRNLGAAVAPLLSLPEMDERTIVMVVLALPLMILYALVATKWFRNHATSDEINTEPSALENAHTHQ